VRKKVLLTGAGFTHNFGAPLSNGMWSWIFNDLTSGSSIKRKMREEYNYEFLYNHILQNDNDYRIEEKTEFIKAVYDAYAYIDKLIDRAILYQLTADGYLSKSNNEIGISVVNLLKFLNLFSVKSGSGYIFTLNQDIMIEKLFQSVNMSNSIMPFSKSVCIPAVHSPVYKPKVTTSGDKEYGIIPDKEELQEWKDKHLDSLDIKGTRTNPIYIKLHGSFDWRYPRHSNTNMQDINNKVMVIGGEKGRQIDKIPLLKFYFDLFEKSLFSKVDLMIIGYGFRDAHINKVLIKAIKEHDLRLYFVNPNSFKTFGENIKDEGVFDNGHEYKIITNAIDGYYQATLSKIFPFDGNEDTIAQNIGSNTPIWSQINKSYFDL